jgi:hypothetical protein
MGSNNPSLEVFFSYFPKRRLLLFPLITASASSSLNGLSSL